MSSKPTQVVDFFTLRFNHPSPLSVVRRRQKLHKVRIPHQAVGPLSPVGWTCRCMGQPHKPMDPACQQGTVQAGGGSVMVWGVCSWSDMGLLIRLDTTLTGDMYATYPSYLITCIHSCPLCIPMDSGNCSRAMQHLTHPELLQSGSRNCLLSLNTFAGHHTPQQ